MNASRLRPGDHVHVVGVAGVGMSAVAQLLLDLGYRVSGSDRFLDSGESLEVLQRLGAAGVTLVPQDGSGVASDTAAVVVSTAIEPDNPDLAAAARVGARTVHRAAMLAELARGRELLAVTGTSGKTTVTGMIGWILEQCGLDPTVVCGGVVLDWQASDRVGNVRSGRGPWVIEADESDRSLLQFEPERAVITNVSKDHFELSEVIALFRRFAAQVRGPIVAGPGVCETLGIRDPHGEPFEPVQENGRWNFRVSGFTFQVSMIGRHNAENAFVASQACLGMGLPPGPVGDALARFRGIHRRLERVGEARGVNVVDDYAHNPAKISASWKAVSERAPRVLGFWRPHGFGPLDLMKNELADAWTAVLRPDDRLYVLPVFYAGGTTAARFTSEDFVALLQERGLAADYAPDYAALEDRLLASCRAGDTILGMGARDPELPRFARRMVERLAHV